MSIIYLPIQSAYGQNIKPFGGALLYVYETGTTTLKTVYSDKAETTPLSNPVVANGEGRFPAMYISGLYKLVCKDENDVTIWTEDNLQGRTGDLVWGGDFSSSTNASNYPASGNQGDWYVVTTGFTLATLSGGYVLNERDFIIANKDGATGIDADWDIVRGKNSVPKDADFSTKNLLIDVQSNTTVDLDADVINILNSDNEVKQVTDVDLTFTMPTDLHAGSEKASTNYWLWIDSDLNKVLVPDLTGTADGTTAGFLEDSGNTFFTDGVKAGDIAYNTKDLTQTTVKTTPTVDGANLEVNDDIFTDTETYLIRLLSPTGLGSFKARLGAAYNNSSSHFDDSFYTQIQEKKSYDENNLAISSSPAIASNRGVEAFVRQVNDWTGAGSWRINGCISYAVASASRNSATLTISGIVNKAGTAANYDPVIIAEGNSGVGPYRGNAVSSTATFVCSHGPLTTTAYFFSFDVPLNKKPTFHK